MTAPSPRCAATASGSSPATSQRCRRSPAAGDLAVATRAGVRQVRVADRADGTPGDVTVGMGRAVLPDGDVTVTVGEHSWPARNVNMGNPHAVAFVDDLDHAGDLLDAPGVTPAPPTPTASTSSSSSTAAPRHVALRVHERGAGETRSCGTGACAVDGRRRPPRRRRPGRHRRPASRTPSTCPADACVITERPGRHGSR